MANSSLYLGVVFDLDGTEIPLEPLTDIKNAADYGIECKLDNPLPLGPAGEKLEGALAAVGADSSAIIKDGEVNADLRDIPVIGDIIQGLLDADLTIEQFYLKIPGKKSASQEKLYNMGIRATWDVDAGEGKLIGSLSLKGVYLKVGNI